MPRKTIKVLPEDLVAKIAAGQVVERPASVVKELVENALDAGATDIIIRLEKAGTEKIIVQDNGHGMTAGELQLAIKPHTTSKIATAEDLLAVSTFGFRGEALPSIGRVSTLIIASRPVDETVGNAITVRQGKVLEVVPQGMPSGTSITIKHLFSAIPARRKYLKSEATELRHILSLLSHLILTFPSVRFELFHNDKKIITALPGSRAERAENVFGTSAKQLIPFTVTENHFSIEGFIGKPQTALSSAAKQYLLINNRVVQHPEIAERIKQAYGSLLEVKKHPVFALFLKIPSDMVDVNVHPQKTNIKIYQEAELLQQIETQVEGVLAKHNLTYQYVETTDPYDFIFDDPGMDEHLAQVIQNVTEAWSVKDIELQTATSVLQIHNLYLLSPTKNGLLIVDQHAAHERILFEQFKKQFLEEREKNRTAQLQKPVKIKLTPEEYETIQAQKQEITTLGFSFDLEKAGLTIFQVPALLENRDIEQLLQELLVDLRKGRANFTIDRESERTLAYLACRSAIKSGEKLTPPERERLIHKLLKTDDYYTCPHGRPTHIEISTYDLAKLFKRV